MDVKKEFSKHANEYKNYNIIQQIVAKALVRDIQTKPKRILELGCGSGQIFNYMDWDIEYYKAIDFSMQMCDLHPKAPFIDIECISFDDAKFLDSIKNSKFDIVISASALQWSKDLPKLLNSLKKSTNQIYAALFTSNTFKTIHNITKKRSPILDINTIKESFCIDYNCSFEVYNYDLKFDSKKDLFDYIKHSGVGASNSKLSFKEAKFLYKEYKLDYLEFEVIFIKAFSKS
jgi:malonyl-CoA O-methyltransferase